MTFYDWIDDPLPVKCSRCGKQHEHDRDCVEDSFDPADHDDREMP